MNTWERKYYRKARAHGLTAVRAIEYARVRDRFENENDDSRVRLVMVPEFAFSDFFNESERELAERDGVWTALAQVARADDAHAERDPANSRKWETVDSIGEIIGDPMESIEYEYATDLRRAALTALDDA